MQLIDPSHGFYRKPWARIAVVAACAAWTVLEIFSGQPFWLVIAGAMTAYSAWMLLINFKPAPESPAAAAEDDTAAATGTAAEEPAETAASALGDQDQQHENDGHEEERRQDDGRIAEDQNGKQP